MTKQPRIFERNGRKVELVGATTKVIVLIDGKQYMPGYFWRSLRSARAAAFSYCQRHA